MRICVVCLMGDSRVDGNWIFLSTLACGVFKAGCESDFGEISALGYSRLDVFLVM